VSKGSTGFIYKVTEIDRGFAMKVLDSRANTKEVVSVEFA